MLSTRLNGSVENQDYEDNLQTEDEGWARMRTSGGYEVTYDDREKCGEGVEDHDLGDL